ncbi:fimbrial biogenesis outer membrane usher protein [Enterobacter sp. Acro-832]|uniref:fimbria/pilus outer membrane usher protein n=1 Tax=Enterobacter sp. Acro-832 TaxID=2608348 RepID=UPI001421090F|nr:fimbria/pilus outer membrane usher protein [Enterobacter sp. Acro-832]NIG42384.1 fimbrial biogenesis outer membrane usher protein [Enterobacter sp. Acro-832]
MMKSMPPQKFKLNYGRVALMLVLTPFMSGAYGSDYFNPALLERVSDNGDTPDLTQFESGSQAEGEYYVDIFVNDSYVDTSSIAFKQIRLNGKTELSPCLTVEMLKRYGVRTDSFSNLETAQSSCVDLREIPEATAALDFKAQALKISVPQASLVSAVRGYVAPDKWDDGLTAAIINYSVTSSHTYTENEDGGASQYLSLRPGVNLGAWRLRNYSNYVRDTHGAGRWDSAYTYAQRGISSVKGQLTLGDSSTPGEIFDSVSIRGVQLASDDEMLPESLRGYAPVVRGIARGDNAEVTIRQNGFVIYQAFMPAGPFEIKDLYPTGGSGDLSVTIKESDGSEQYQIVPFASLPILQRAGNLRYAFSVGHYRSYENSAEDAPVWQSTLIYGLPAGFTLYGGVQVASNYRSSSLGVGKNLGNLGAFSTDITHSANSRNAGKVSKGQSVRARYSKSMATTGTNIAIAGYRYSTSDFYTLNDAFELRNDSNDFYYQERRRNRAELTLTQNLGNSAGYLSASIVRQDYWGNNRKTDSWSVGYSNSFKGVGYSLNYSLNKDVNNSRQQTSDRIFAFTLSMPLSLFSKTTYAGYSFSNNRTGGTNQNVSLSGTALEGDSLSWSVAEGYGSKGQGNTGYSRANYKGTYGELNGAYSYSAQGKILNYGAQGTLLIHEDGITAGQSGGETLALIKVPGATGLRVNNQQGVKTDSRGYALVPFVSPFRNNELALSTESMPDDVDVEVTSRNVVPTRGAVVRATFSAKVGQRALVTLKRPDGKFVPFGATVSYGSESDEAAIVGDQGQVYLSGLTNINTLYVKWGNELSRQCAAKFELPDIKKSLIDIAAVCR